MKELNEVWKDIEGYEGLYQVSNLGKVKSLERIDSLGRVVHEKILNQCFDSKKRYLMVTLSKGGIHKKILVHLLVGKAFIKGYKKGLQIDHKDTMTTNNKANNLKWVTKSENMLNPLTRINNSNGQIKRFLKYNPNCKKVIQKSLTGETIKIWESLKEAAKHIGVCHQTLSDACMGRQKTSKGYIWEYAKEVNVDGN